MKHNKLFENGKYVPQRMCVACRNVRPKHEMLRITLYQGVARVDMGDIKQGRGAYVCNRAECIQKAEKTKGLQRGLKTNVSQEIYRECMKLGGK